MFKKFLFAAAFVMASNPAFVSAQDFFFSFDEFSRQPSITIDPSTTATGQVFIFSDANLEFTAIDLDFTHDNSSVVAFTGATTANTDQQFTTLLTQDPNNVGTSPVTPITETEGRLFGVSFSFPPLGVNSGIQPALAANDSDFRAGANGFLLATVDFDVVGPGAANFDFVLGALGIENDFDGFFAGPGPIDVDLTGSTATVTVEAIPEPSSAMLLILGAAGSLARRRRS